MTEIYSARATESKLARFDTRCVHIYIYMRFMGAVGGGGGGNFAVFIYGCCVLYDGNRIENKQRCPDWGSGVDVDADSICVFK